MESDGHWLKREKVFSKIIGKETKKQILEQEKQLPKAIMLV